MDITPIIHGLNEAQRNAVTSESSHQLVLAGAGSGKTRVLIHRMAWIIDVLQSSPGSILMVTFTNKAAKELQHRVESMLTMKPNGLWVGTFHSIGHRLLRLHWQEAGLPQNFQIIDSDDQLRLVKKVIRELNLDDKRWVPKGAQWFINGQKEAGIRPDFVEVSDYFSQTHRDIYAVYQQHCERSGLVDFAEILLRSHELWLNQPEVLLHYRQRFQHILVDEFQDTNSLQYAWIRVLAGEQSSVMVVGDDDQSIYGWRGAKIENIFNFQEDFVNTEVTRLEQNYRSTETILSAANAVISKNQQRLGKDLWTDLGKGEVIDLYNGSNEYDESDFIVNYLQRWKETITDENQPRKFEDIAILYRSNAQSRVLEEALIRSNIAYRIYGGQRFYERLEIRNALAYLRLIETPEDDSAIERILNVPPRSIGLRTVEKLREVARDHNFTLWQAINKAVDNNLFSGKTLQALLSFQQLVNSLQSAQQDLLLHELLEQMLEQTGLLNYHAQEKGERGEARVENLKELISACQVFKTDTQDGTVLAAFLAEASLDAGDRQAADYQDAVQMMTLHSAKGLEFPLVVITGMENNLFPHALSEQEGNLEEERRLCYVGITRAKENLLLTHAMTRRLHGKEVYNPPSMFLRDIPPQLIRPVRLGQQNGLANSRAFNYDSVKSVEASTSSHDDRLALGQLVSHPVFGMGTIMNYEGRGAHLRVEVNFVDEGSKWLIYSYARLEAI